MAAILRFGSSGPPLLLNDRAITQPTAELFEQEYAAATRRSPLRKFGFNPSADTPGPEDVWSAGGLYAGWLTAAERLRAVSTSAEDAPGGLGASSLLLEPHTPAFDWLDSDPVPLTMNGTSLTSLTADAFIRCTRAACAGAGQYANGSVSGTNIGDITIQTESGIVVAHIPAGSGGTEMTHFTVPAGYAYYLEDIHYTVNDQQPGNVNLFFRSQADVVVAPFAPRRQLFTHAGLSGAVDFTYDFKVRFPEKTDIWMRVTPGSNATFVTGEHFGLLLRLG